MNNISAPIFRKSVKGYNKNDVNAYILTLSRRLDESEQACADLSAQNADMHTKITALEASAERIPYLLNEISELTAKLDECTAKLNECTALLHSAQSANAELQKRAEDAESAASEKAAEYDNICRSAGQIFALAGNTAEEILQRADNEAHKIVERANTTKDTVFKTISETTEGFTSDLSDYIKNSINDCIRKINETAKEYTPKDSAPSVKFIDAQDD